MAPSLWQRESGLQGEEKKRRLQINLHGIGRLLLCGGRRGNNPEFGAGGIDLDLARAGEKEAGAGGRKRRPKTPMRALYARGASSFPS